MQRYFIKNTQMHDGIIEADSVMHKHISKVMRYTNGTHVICIDEDHNVYDCTIADVTKGVLIKEKHIDENHELDVDVTLVYGLPKGDKFEFVLKKATELGVSRIVPFMCQRSIIRTDAKSLKKKYERYNRIIQEAAEQSEREILPEITELANIKTLHQYLSEVNLVAYEEASRNHEESTFHQALSQLTKSITIIVGPEGGFDESEIEAMETLGIKRCGLGKRILRSETAPLYMLSVIGYERELNNNGIY
ncbi:16S rRNA (uracil(1498)-N(3))-methyltransferase [Sharpea azabuensis]|uniref:Ribosomal RNA small subunit methyltransferase E n=1 Tax=Sharpea porci TaxID=2652286 RepID=A0A844FV82_9FIRM|nr:RsmE family RNA methyltransferase [Sharpea porci]MST89634.1 16S rRNA (uracil(1498)-N(3))-methyltransferase [Sharpea porci]